MDYARIDAFALDGYKYAQSGSKMPRFVDQMDIDAFNAGISWYNNVHNGHVLKIYEGMKSVYIQGSNNRTADKELAIVGA